MSGIASPPRGVWQYSASDSGRWLTLFTLATFGSFGASLPHRVSPHRRTVARRSGQTLAAVRSHLRKLAADGMLAPRDRGWLLDADPRPWPPGARPPAAPPAELLELEGLGAGVKRCAIGLWSFADYAAEGGAIDGGVVVHPTRGELAERTGQTERAVRNQLRAAFALGIARRVDGGLELSRPQERRFRPPESPTDAAPRIAWSAPTVTWPAPRIASDRPPGSPHTLQDLAIPNTSASDGLDGLPLFAGADGESAASAVDIAKMSAHPRGEQVRALWAEYNSLRVAAAKGHGRRAQALELTAARASSVARAVREHGFDVVLEALRWRGSVWASSAESWDRFSLHMWTERSVAAAISGMGRPRADRRGAGRGAGAGATSRLLAIGEEE